ncbi:thrombospondin type 3 repeat-containing protein [Fibrobacter sp.]|uniref:thrombospondin type 3 repeat-containing protein n=1 Tax=Fibrobacter sp. TaxID=35828 RepID=UPI0025B9B060|nr:thrombospondin type 3 repeat-containing protein [Fibrobacter sp.]MBS7270909.1 thrombospondin type 3 repeat-containing protein [Fibrobacter sp.]MCI6438329.1 thrombospondin type 3 repeat-containing protein [Fibrobacter sp.]
MKKLFAALLLLSIAASAQVGIARSASGIHAPSAKTLPQGNLFISGSFEIVNDGQAHSIEGYYTDNKGNQIELDEGSPSNDENLFVGFGIFDNLEIGITLPFHYEGDIHEQDLKGLALGDLQILAKGHIPINDWFHFGLSGEIFAPTGSKDKGFRPRRRWYVGRDGKAYAYTAGSWAVEGNVYFTLDFRDYITYNAYVGILKTIEENENYIIWGTGFNFFTNMMISPIFEVSGEAPLHTTHAENNFLSSPFRLTPGLRIHLPYESNLTISGDIGLGYFRKKKIEEGLPVTLMSSDEPIYYTQSGSPNLTIAVTFSKTLDFSWDDDDQDGVIDRKDMCPNTGKNLKVNERGCPVDEDQDGVLNIVDVCPGTPVGLVVDYNGCPLDTDHDGVFDYLDHCSNTPEGFAVDSSGCTRDTDGDGIDDNNDHCAHTPTHERVGSDGCPLDQDHDGVPNIQDQCPNTPEGISVDRVGCPLDFDGDAVPDELDKCPNTILGEKVDSLGCPIDSDMDGVADSKDLCPETPAGVTVNKQGCRIDQDNDGVFDEDDKCPGTPEGAPIDSLGCPQDSDMDGIADWNDMCPGTFPNVAVNNQGCPLNGKLNFNYIAMRIRFKGADSTLLNSSYTALNDIVYIMRKSPMALEIQCSASDISTGDPDKVSSERAEAIYNYLVHKGISENRLKFQGFGKKLPPTMPKRMESNYSVRLIPSPEAKNNTEKQ